MIKNIKLEQNNTNQPHFDDVYWNNRYSSNATNWDLGMVSPPIKNYIDQLQDKEISILIPGCGNAYEAEYLLDSGFKNVTIVDISPLLIRQLESKFKTYTDVNLNIVCDDFFNIEGKFDLILEQTFFCAIRPHFRKKYKDKIYELLTHEGKLVGLLFDREFVGNPPFGGSRAEYRYLFENDFFIKCMQPCYNSIEPRQGAELFIILIKDTTILS